jgi:hypothetical protein
MTVAISSREVSDSQALGQPQRTAMVNLVRGAPSSNARSRWTLFCVAVVCFVAGRTSWNLDIALAFSNPNLDFAAAVISDPRKPTSDLLPHLQNCELPQSPASLSELAEKYKPSKFWRYAHTNFDRFYPEHLEKYRTKVFKMLEIGLDTGAGSLLWQEYFPCVEMVGLEYAADKVATTGAAAIKTIQGDQGDAVFMSGSFMQQSGGQFDVIIDDGGHHYEHQRTSYEILFEKALNPGGLYLLEDIETSYWSQGRDLYGNPVTRGGQSEPNTIVNHFKAMVDVINKKFYDNTATVFGPVDHLVATMTFGSNLIVLKKKDVTHCFGESLYVWPAKLADDCPAKSQNGNILQGSSMHKMCGDHILVRDKPNARNKWTLT